MEVSETLGREALHQLRRRCEGAVRALVETLQVGHRHRLQTANAIALHVFVGIRVETGRHRDAERLGGLHRRFSQRAFRGNVDHIQRLRCLNEPEIPTRT